MTPPSLYLLDTNIVIHYARGKAVGQRIEHDYGLLTTPYRPLICVVTKGETGSFARRRGWGAPRMASLSQLLAHFVLVDINDQQLIDAYSEIDCFSLSKGRQMGKNDLWIAAAAHVSAATLMTTDADFDHLRPAYLSLIRIDSNTGQTI